MCHCALCSSQCLIVPAHLRSHPTWLSRSPPSRSRSIPILQLYLIRQVRVVGLHIGRGRVLELTHEDPANMARARARARRPRVATGTTSLRVELAVSAARVLEESWVRVQRCVGDLGGRRGGECYRGEAFFRHIAGGAAVQGGLWSTSLIKDRNLGRRDGVGRTRCPSFG